MLFRALGVSPRALPQRCETTSKCHSTLAQQATHLQLPSLRPQEVQALLSVTHPQGTEPALKPRKKGSRVCVLNCRPAASEHVLYTKDCTNMAHATLIMPLGDGIPASFWRTRENEAKTGMGQARVTRLRSWLSLQTVTGNSECLSHHPCKRFCFLSPKPHKGGCHWIKQCSPPATKFHVHPPVTCECDLIWKKSLYRCDRVKMRSCWIRVGPYKKRKIWTETHRGKTAMYDAGRDWNV